MSIDLREERPSVLAGYSQVSGAFQVETRYRAELIHGGLGGILLHEERVVPPYVKDYDLGEGGGPAGWLARWDLSQWGILCAYDGARRVGGAVVARNTPGVEVLDGRSDLAVLWDVRVAPDYRRRGIGTDLFRAAVAWACTKGCPQIKVESQNVNVPACRFYAKHGCHLRAIGLHEYMGVPDESLLVWYLDLV